MNEYEDPKHRLFFYGKMLEMIPAVKAILPFGFGLCSLIRHTAYLDVFYEEKDLPIMDDLYELKQQAPTSETWDMGFWWDKSLLEPRIEAIHKAIELVKEKINNHE